jgi:lysine-N-methylase
MKRIRPDYYDKFTCIADQCSITCCQEWKIGVDADTNRKWKKIFPPEDVSPQKKNLSAYTTKKDGGRVIELTEEHKCPFLNENKLCKLVTAYGENVLSETCAVFPREVHRFETHEEETLMPCCPAVIDLLREEEPQRIYAGKTTRFYIREKLTELFLDEDYRVEESLLCGFYIIRELFDKCGQDEKLSELAEDYFSTENQQQLRRAIAEIERDPFATMEERNELLQDLAVNYRKEGLYRNYLNPVIEKAEELSGLFENIGNPADAAKQCIQDNPELADELEKLIFDALKDKE